MTDVPRLTAEGELGTREVARRLSVHENTVRNWVREGYMSPVRRLASGYMKFTEQEVARIAALGHAHRVTPTALSRPARKVITALCERESALLDEMASDGKLEANARIGKLEAGGQDLDMTVVEYRLVIEQLLALMRVDGARDRTMPA